MQFRKEYSAYMTLEATFIVSWTIFILVWIIYLGYFEYDRCLAFQEDYLLVTQTAGQILSDADAQFFLNRLINSANTKKFLCVTEIDTAGVLNKDKVSVTTSFVVKHSIFSNMDIIPKALWEIKDSVSVDRFSYTKKIRFYRTVGRVIG